jgi:hypothetical protein
MLRVGVGCGAGNTTTTGLTNVSASGWMNDFGEYIPFDGVLGGGSDSTQDPFKVHNAYPQLWAQTVREATDEAQGLVTSRATTTTTDVAAAVAEGGGGSGSDSGSVSSSSSSNDVIFFSRSSAARSPSYSPLFWMGTSRRQSVCPPVHVSK